MSDKQIFFHQPQKYDKSAYGKALLFHREIMESAKSTCTLTIRDIVSFAETLNSNGALSEESKYYLNKLLECCESDSLQWLIKNQPYIAKQIIEDARLDVNSLCLEAMLSR